VEDRGCNPFWNTPDIPNNSTNFHSQEELKMLKVFLEQIIREERIDHISQIIQKRYPLEYQKIRERTKYLPAINPFMERVYHIINNLTFAPLCSCGKKLKFISYGKGYSQFCGAVCAGLFVQNDPKVIVKKANTKMLRYGSPTYNNPEKQKKTMLLKYGVNHALQSPKIKEKLKQTCLKKFGVHCHLKNPRIFKKIKQTKLNKYGDEYYNNVVKIKQTKLNKYGDEYYNNSRKAQTTNLGKFYQQLLQSKTFINNYAPLFTIDEYRGGKIDSDNLVYYKFQCKKCGNIFETTLANGHIPRCFKCLPIDRFTIPHKTICEYLDSLGIQYEIEKYIKPYFIDIFISPNKIIEVYGDYWHGNPKIFKETDEIGFSNHKKITVKEKWEQDNQRISYLKGKNISVLVLWEDEIKNDFSSVGEKIKNFIVKKEKNNK
jgi:G:T-mismatch repair DNA endonuclease (very short patch repair protein)